MDTSHLLSELESIGAIGDKVVRLRPTPEPKPAPAVEDAPKVPQAEATKRELLVASLSAARTELVGLTESVADLHERLTRLGRTLDVLQEAVLLQPTVKGAEHEAIQEAG